MDELQTLRLALDEAEARQLAVMKVVKLMLKHHPDAETLRQDARQEAQTLERGLLFAPLSDRMAEVALETYRSLLGVPSARDGDQQEETRAPL